MAEEFDPQVCLLDLTMPGTDGLELTARLKARAAGRPLLLVGTAAPGEFGSGARTAAAEFHDHLVRPVDVPTLVEALSRLFPEERLGNPWLPEELSEAQRQILCFFGIYRWWQDQRKLVAEGEVELVGGAQYA